MSRVVPFFVALAMLACVSAIPCRGADPVHHDGQAKVGDKLNTKGVHHIDSVADHKVHAHVDKNGKIEDMSAHHKDDKTKRVAPKYVKTTRQKHALLNDKKSSEVYAFVSTGVVEERYDDFVFIGFMFTFGNQVFIYWFPVNLVTIKLNVCIDVTNC